MHGFLDILLYKKTNLDIVQSPANFVLNPNLDKIKNKSRTL